MASSLRLADLARNPLGATSAPLTAFGGPLPQRKSSGGDFGGERRSLCILGVLGVNPVEPPPPIPSRIKCRAAYRAFTGVGLNSRYAEHGHIPVVQVPVL